MYYQLTMHMYFSFQQSYLSTNPTFTQIQKINQKEFTSFEHCELQDIEDHENLPGTKPPFQTENHVNQKE